MNELQVFCPATIANVSCGFDVLGLCLDHVGDTMTIRKSEEKGLRITKITGADLPLEIDKNVAGVAAVALLKEHLTLDFGIEMEIHKNIKAGSGIGSSAASAAGAVVGINKLLGEPFDKITLVRFAMQGEALACGTAHADNVAPAILGGFTLVRSADPLDVIQLPSPKELVATVVHPMVEIKTSDARAVLKKQITLKQAIQQWGNVASFVSGLHTEDYDLLSRSMEDVIIEPVRSVLIPYYKEVKQAAMDAGALGGGISGSGPSIFALSKGKQTAEKVLKAMVGVYEQKGLAHEPHLSTIATQGVKVI